MVLQTLLEKSRVATQELDRAQMGVGVLLVPLTYVVVQQLYVALRGEKGQVKDAKLYRPPTTLPVLGNTLDFARRVAKFHHWMTEVCNDAQGTPVLLRTLGQPPMVIISTPEAVEDVSKTQFDAFPKGQQQREILGSVLGEGIIAVDGAKWVHQRKIAARLFTTRALRDSMSTTMRKYTAVLLRILERAQRSGESFDLFKLLNRFTIEAFAEIGFGIQMNCLEAEDEHPFQSAFDSIQRAVSLRFMLPPWLTKLQQIFGIGPEGQFKKDLKVIDDTVYEIVSGSIKRRQNNEQPRDTADLVSLFLDHFDKYSEDDKKEYDAKYLRDMVVTFLIAGRDTTAQALSWFFLSISREPRVVKKIREEIKVILPELLEGKIETPTMEQVQQLTYLEAALKETLRLYPSVPVTPKSAEQDAVLSNGTFIKKGTRIGIPTYAMGRMPYVWGPDAAKFKPERWIDPETGKIIQVSPFKFFSFNAGPRTCLGMNLALLEMKIVAASVLSRFDLNVLNEKDITYDFSVTLPMQGELRVHAVEAPRTL